TVGVRVRVHQVQPLFKTGDALHREDRSENLLIADGHARLHVIEDAGAEIETVFVTVYNRSPAIKDEAAAFVHTALYPVGHRFAMLLGDERAKFRRLFVSRPEPSLACKTNQCVD